MYEEAAVIWDITNRIQRKSTAPDELDARVSSHFVEEQGLFVNCHRIRYVSNMQ